MSGADIDLKAIHEVIINFDKRAERASNEALVATFVDSAPLFNLLSTTNNQVIYGRRGTGKTHALKFLAESTEKNKNNPIYVDLRTVGSNGSIYSDVSRSLIERASTLIVDVLIALHDEFISLALKQISTHPNPDEITRRLDAFRESITSIKVSGTTEIEKTAAQGSSQNSTISAGAKLNSSPSIDLSSSSGKTEKMNGAYGSVESGSKLSN